MLYVFMAVLGYSFLPTLTKFILADGLKPLDMAFWRFLFAAPAFWLVIAARRIPTPDVPLPRYRLLALGSIIAVSAVSAFFGLQYVPAATFVVLFYTYPSIVALLSVLLGERLPPIGWFALALTFVGVALTAPDFSAGLSAGGTIGALLALFNAVIVAIYFMLNSRVLRGHTALARGSAWVITGALLVMTAVSLTRQVAVPPTLRSWAFLFALAVGCTVLPVFSLTTGIHKLGPARAAILGTVEPPLTAFWAMLFLNETMQPIQVLGAACILGSVILLQLRRPPTPGTVKVEAAAG